MPGYSKEMIAVEQCAYDTGISSEQIIAGIKTGDYTEVLLKDVCFVSPSTIIDKDIPTENDVINGIKSGIYDGVNVFGHWYVLVSSIFSRLDLTDDEIVSKIRSGTYTGRKIKEKWYVLPASILALRMPEESDFLTLRKKLLIWMCAPPVVMVCVIDAGYYRNYDDELTYLLISGILFILMLSWITGMFSYRVIVQSRTRLKLASSEFGLKVWLVVSIWMCIAIATGYTWNYMAVDNWMKAINTYSVERIHRTN